ncbi:MAG: hypothetical protein ACOX3J_01440 [Clostridia bacterium]
MKRFFSFVLILILLTSTVPINADNEPTHKEEVVYGILNLDGSVKGIHVVNIFEGGKILDYGNYSEIRNLTSSEKINKDGDRITIDTSSDKFYYQGTLKKKELPWVISIKYYFDNKEIKGDELGGKSGDLKIHITVKKNKNVNDVFFNNHALQISLSLDNRLCRNIKSENATVAEAGSKKQLAYTVLPGFEADIVVTATVKDFEMDPIQINGIRLNMGMDVDTGEFTRQISELVNAIRLLDEGADGLLDGAANLANGMQSYIDGLNAFKNGLSLLPDSVNEIYNGVSQVSYGLNELAKQNDSLLAGALAIQQATFETVNMQLAGMGLPTLTPENYSAILAPIPQLAEVKLKLDEIVQFTEGLKSYLNGVGEISSGTKELERGMSEFKSSANTIAASANEIYSAAVTINNGIKGLKEGLNEYKQGTGQLREGTKDLVAMIDTQLSEILSLISEGDDEVVSFVSDKNTNVDSVQFVLKTDSIEKPVSEKPDSPKSPTLSFWQRLLKLFGLYKDKDE